MRHVKFVCGAGRWGEMAQGHGCCAPRPVIVWRTNSVAHFCFHWCFSIVFLFCQCSFDCLVISSDCVEFCPYFYFIFSSLHQLHSVCFVILSRFFCHSVIRHHQQLLRVYRCVEVAGVRCWPMGGDGAGPRLLRTTASHCMAHRQCRSFLFSLVLFYCLSLLPVFI
ncbi:hypothetical protein TcCL_ESM10832 [Trypanosoma cruzi]|nr:hypothetical protein TcCL_ESM10832 [Trypanosoma cruzi]